MRDKLAVAESDPLAATLYRVFFDPTQVRSIARRDVRIEAGERAPTTVIPREAVVENEGEKIVYVPLSSEEFRRQEVKLGGEYDGKVAVLEGLKAGKRKLGLASSQDTFAL
jgi:multidrug efflux pump subunit AcrA (membrane-fusion protein)